MARERAWQLADLAAPSADCWLAVGSDELYWAELGSYVGRATLQGTHIVAK